MRILLFVFCFLPAWAQTQYQHILITNDDGIEDADRLLALARAVAPLTDKVSVVVSDFDRSGTSNHTTFGKHQTSLEVRCRYRSDDGKIQAYSLPGNPADCVLIGLSGLFEVRPDLVLSGINGGPNIGPGWYGGRGQDCCIPWGERYCAFRV